MEALESLVPGQEILTDLPVLQISTDCLQKYSKLDFGDLVAVWSAFVNEGKERQAKVLSLFGPTDEVFKAFAKTVVEKEDEDTFAKVASVYRYNSFGNNNGKTIYETVSRMSHSCQPNCEVKFEGTSAVVRAVFPVKAGEELTIAYNDVVNEPTHGRRLRYLLNKDFTCHCPRCDALGVHLL